LPPELRAVAELRLRLPDATLAELGDAALPRLTKSAVASRLRRIVQRADL
jgi:DNA-binding transcriptional regulator WhiA